ncbi:MAG TPA: outer membrane lipoprotein carrier protein LolA [Candidatus Sulfotelmatobacter sp.]|nr:outer membrane lipoprotein carrier protein LolA [Candidatus Sulfotelmatobacter sp.]
MKALSMFLPVALASILAGAAVAQTPTGSAGLDPVLKKMDEMSAKFTSAQADFEWDRYEKVINEIDTVQTGTISYRRSGKDVEMMAEVKKEGPTLDQLKADPKYVLFKGGKVQVFQPKPNQVTEWDLGKNASDFESYLVLGFGGSGEDLVKQFDVTYLGPETIDGKATAKLQLIPKSDRVRNNFKQILLWIDLDRGISIQQQFTEPQGDYRLSKYHSVQLNQKINNDVFRLKTNGKTETVSPRG